MPYYSVEMTVGDVYEAGTDDPVEVCLHFKDGTTSGWTTLKSHPDDPYVDFRRNSSHPYSIRVDTDRGAPTAIEIRKNGSDGLCLTDITVTAPDDSKYLWTGGSNFERDWIDTPKEHKPGAYTSHGDHVTFGLSPKAGYLSKEEQAQREKSLAEAAAQDTASTKEWYEKQGLVWEKLSPAERAKQVRQWKKQDFEKRQREEQEKGADLGQLRAKLNEEWAKGEGVEWNKLTEKQKFNQEAKWGEQFSDWCKSRGVKWTTLSTEEQQAARIEWHKQRLAEIAKKAEQDSSGGQEQGTEDAEDQEQDAEDSSGGQEQDAEDAEDQEQDAEDSSGGQEQGTEDAEDQEQDAEDSSGGQEQDAEDAEDQEQDAEDSSGGQEQGTEDAEDQEQDAEDSSGGQEQDAEDQEQDAEDTEDQEQEQD